MRAIDADALYKDICRAYDECDDILEIIDKQPTIEPRKGKWVEIQDDIFAPIVVCSNCGQTAMVDLYGEYQRTRYCPNCGSKMKEENKN